MADDFAPYREATVNDRLCDGCGEPMIGIMACSDYRGYNAPRTRHDECKKLEKRNENATRTRPRN